MKCLSLWQPWATLIVIGAKRIETRHWETSHRGPLLIHAAKKWTRELKDMCFDEPFSSAIAKNRPNRGGAFFLGDILDELLPRGCILGVCDLVKCWPTEDLHVVTHAGQPALTPMEREFGDYSDGRFGWLLSNIRRFPVPIPFKGHQQIFNVPENLAAEQLRSAVAV